MKINKKAIIIFIITSFTSIIFLVIFTMNRQNIAPPFKCLFFTQYDLQNYNILAVSQDLRLYSMSSSYLLVNGKAETKDGNFRIARSIILKDGEYLNGKTYKFKINRINRLDSDNAPDSILDEYLSEFQSDRGIFQIDIFKVDSKTYVIGGPYSFISNCVRY